MRSRCRAALKAHGIKTSTVYDYQRSLAPLISYMEAKGIKSYTSALGEEFAMTLKYDSGMSCNKRNDVYKYSLIRRLFLPITLSQKGRICRKCTSSRRIKRDSRPLHLIKPRPVRRE